MNLPLQFTPTKQLAIYLTVCYELEVIQDDVQWSRFGVWTATTYSVRWIWSSSFWVYNRAVAGVFNIGP